VFLVSNAQQPLSALAILAHALRPAPVSGLLAVAWVGCAFALTVDWFITGRVARWLGVFIGALVLSGVLALAYAYLIAGQLAVIGPMPTAAALPDPLLRQAVGYETVYLTFMAASLGLVLFGGLAASAAVVQAGAKSSKSGIAVALVALACIAATGYVVNLKPVLGDVSLHWAETLHIVKVWPGCVSVYARAVELEPDNHHYRDRLARVLVEVAGASSDETTLNSLMSQATTVFKECDELPGYRRNSWYLGRVYMIWAGHEKEKDRKVELARHAIGALERALKWEPANPLIWSDLAQVDLQLLDQEAEGMRMNRKALEVDPRCEVAYTVLGEFYVRKSREAADPDERKKFTLQAIAAYSSAADASSGRFTYHVTRGNLYRSLADPEHAVSCYMEAVKKAPAEERWRAEALLARAYLECQDKPAALKHIQLAIQKAPVEQLQVLFDLKRQITVAP